MSELETLESLDEKQDDKREARTECGLWTACRQVFLEDEMSMVPVLEEELSKVKDERDLYRQAFSEMVKQVNEMLAGNQLIRSFWSELVSKIHYVSRSYGVMSRDGVFDIWTFLTENSLEAKLALAESQCVMLRVFQSIPMDFLVLIEDEQHPTGLPDSSVLLYSVNS